MKEELWLILHDINNLLMGEPKSDNLSLDIHNIPEVYSKILHFINKLL